jgi:hypothetical protein
LNFFVLCLVESDISSRLEGIHTPSNVVARFSPGLSLLTKVYQYKEASKVQSEPFFQYHITTAVTNDKQLQNGWRPALKTLQALILTPVKIKCVVVSLFCS